VSGDRCEITVLKSFRIFYGKSGKYSKMLATTGVTIEKQQDLDSNTKIWEQIFCLTDSCSCRVMPLYVGPSHWRRVKHFHVCFVFQDGQKCSCTNLAFFMLVFDKSITCTGFHTKKDNANTLSLNES